MSRTDPFQEQMMAFGNTVRVLSCRVLFAFAVLVAGPDGVSAQSPTFTACYVPDVGAIYMIRLQGLPNECLSTSHQEVSWTDGGDGTLDPGSVDTRALADGSVSTAKLAAGSVTGDKLSINYRLVTREVAKGNSLTSATIQCDPGEVVISGGWQFNNFSSSSRTPLVYRSMPLDERTWEVAVIDTETAWQTGQIRAVCADL